MVSVFPATRLNSWRTPRQCETITVATELISEEGRVSRVLRFAIVGVTAAVVAAGIAALALASTPASTRTAGADSPSGVTVTAGPPLRAAPPGVSKQADALAFFPRVATITAGQSVTFDIAGFHTVTFANRKDFPLVVPSPPGKQPATNDAAGEPLWWGGAAPLLGLNPRAIPQLGGATISSPSQVRSSGLQRLLAAGNKPPKPYILTFTKPGLYRFFCIVHAGMHGAIRVLPSTATAPPASQATAHAQAELSNVLASIKSVQATNPTEKLTVWIGTGKLSGAEVTSFFPKRLVVNTGDTVKFVQHDPTDIHTVTFGTKAYTAQIEKAFIGPRGAFDPFAVFPSEPPGPPGTPVSYDGTNHGNGYLNAGIVYPYTTKQTPHLFRVTFTRAGVYHFECVIHPNMDGTIVVR